MSPSSLGSVYALLTALSWGVAVILFKKSGDFVPPTALNYIKDLIGLILLLLTFLVMDLELIQPAPIDEIILLIISGAIGIGIADTILFRSLNLLGASRSAIVSCLYAPFVVMFSGVLLDEELSSMMVVGGLLVIAGIVLTARKRSDPLPRGQLVEGIFLGVLAEGLMSVCIVAVKPILETHSVLWSTTVRMAGGVVLLTLLVIGSKALRTQFITALRPNRAWRYAIPGSVVGAYGAILLWIAGFKYTTAMLASILNQTSTLWVVLLAALFLRERLTVTKVFAVGLGFLGSLVVLL